MSDRALANLSKIENKRRRNVEENVQPKFKVYYFHTCTIIYELKVVEVLYQELGSLVRSQKRYRSRNTCLHQV